ncbi:hypothetical protein ACFL59_03285 [Planctomycetota bacterium]
MLSARAAVHKGLLVWLLRLLLAVIASLPIAGGVLMLSLRDEAALQVSSGGESVPTVFTGIFEATEKTETKEGLAAYREERRTGTIRKRWSEVDYGRLWGCLRTETATYTLAGRPRLHHVALATRKLGDDHRISGIPPGATVTVYGEPRAGGSAIYGRVYLGSPEEVAVAVTAHNRWVSWLAYAVIAFGVLLWLKVVWPKRRGASDAEGATEATAPTADDS